MDATLVTRRTPSRRLARAVVILVAMTALFLGTGATSASAVMDPGGTGSSAHTTISCDAIGHQMWVYTESMAGYSMVATAETKLYASVGGRPWIVFYDWTGVGSSLSQHYDMRLQAGVKMYWYAGYRWSPVFAPSQVTYGGEYPSIYQWNGSTRHWVASNACYL